MNETYIYYITNGSFKSEPRKYCFFFSQNDANTNEFLGHHLSTFSLQQGRTYINRQMEYT